MFFVTFLSKYFLRLGSYISYHTHLNLWRIRIYVIFICRFLVSKILSFPFLTRNANKLYILLYGNHVASRHLYKLFVYYVILLLYRTRSLVSNRLPHADFEFERTLVVVWAVNEQASANIKWAGSPIEAPILEVVNPHWMVEQRIYFVSQNLHHKYTFLKVHRNCSRNVIYIHC